MQSIVKFSKGKYCGSAVTIRLLFYVEKDIGFKMIPL